MCVIDVGGKQGSTAGALWDIVGHQPGSWGGGTGPCFLHIPVAGLVGNQLSIKSQLFFQTQLLFSV